tara:strand:+ start:2566 stop:3666 length:1101 start_codon:yes stop_codon:yes gene_type:complete
MPNTNIYKKSLEWLEDLNQNKIVPGLERIQKIMKLLGNPQDKLRVISIGGTNAKGSTSYNLSKTLMQTGKKIGCFTSPHLHSVRERIKINDKNISKEEFAKNLFDLRDLAKKNNIEVTYFETLTALAYHYFLSKRVDFAIMEIGLGGEWDAVNVADAEIAILTTLGLDHTEYLGNSLEEIAKTKAKIVREETTLITGWEKNYHKHIPRCKNIFHAKTIGDWIKICIECLGLSIKPIIDPIPGRKEIYLNFTLDTAHNQQAINFLLSNDKKYQIIILGMLKDKDIDKFVYELPDDCVVLACNLDSERGATSREIADICKKKNIMCKQYENVRKAIKSVNSEKTLITGSFYTVSEAREYFKLDGYSEL